MSTLILDQKKARQEEELRIQRQIAFASGLFQGDVTVRTLLESLAEGVVIIDKSGTILLVNSSAEQMFGYQGKELIGKPQAVLIPERFRKVHEEHQAGYFAEPRIRPIDQHLDLAGRRRDGSEFPVEISLSYIETINGVLVLTLVSDITLRKQFEMRLLESEELFHIQVEGVQNYAIFMLDTQGNVLNWNAGAERLKGYKENEIIGKHFSCFYPEEERNACKPEEELKKAAAEGRFADEGWRIRKDGSRFWADVIITALYDESGNLRGFSKVAHDISERKKTEDALRFIEARYRALYHDNPTMIVTLDADLTMLSVNPFCASQLGYTIDELEGQSVLKLFHEDDRLTVAEQLRICLKNPNQVKHWQFRKIRKDGGLLWVEETAQAVYDLSRALNILVVCQDITERKQLEAEIQDAREYAENIVETVREPLVVLNSDLKILTANHSFYDTFKVTPEETIGNFIYDLGNRQWDIPKLRVLFEEILPLDTVFNGYEVEHDFPDIGRKIILLNARQIFREKIGSRIILLAMEDITERKRAEEERERLLLQLEAVLESINEGVVISDLEGKVLTMNKEVLALYEYESLGQVRRPLSEYQDVIELIDFEGVSVPFEQWPTFRALRGERFVDYEVRVRCKDSGKMWIGSYCGTPVRSKSGDIILSVVTVRDVTERKFAEKEIERLNVSLTARAADLEYTNRELEAFNYTVAHDLRNPLNVISSYCQVFKELCDDKLDEQCRHYIQETYDGTLRMNRLIEALLNFSRLAHVELNRDRVDLSSMAREVVEELKGAEAARRVEIRVADGIVANGDANLLRVVLTNLLDNAWKYTAMREEAVIEFGAKEIDGKPVYFVRDNGNGFNMADSEKLFAPFQRLPGAEECRGFGIGLATVERIVRRHGGRVCAEGEPGKGATFYFTLSTD